MKSQKNLQYFTFVADESRHQVVLLGPEGSGKSSFLLENPEIFNSESIMVYTPYNVLYEKRFYKAKLAAFQNFLNLSIANYYLDKFDTLIIDDIEFFSSRIVRYIHNSTRQNSKSFIILARDERELSKLGLRLKPDTKRLLEVREHYVSTIELWDFEVIEGWHCSMHKDSWFDINLDATVEME
jgi:hypothetical protein